MTIIIGATFEGITLMGADTRVTEDPYVLRTSESKLVRFKKFMVGVAGYGAVTETLLELQKKAPEKLGSKLEVMEFAKDYFRAYNKMEDSENKSATLLICTKTDIWYIPSRSAVFKMDGFWAIGTGAPFALGRMYDDFEKIQSIGELGDLVMRSMVVAQKLDPNCGEPLDLVEV